MLTQTERYAYSPIARREKMRFPDGARVAVLEQEMRELREIVQRLGSAGL